MQELSDRELAVRARGGDDGALDEIYRRFTPLVAAIARKSLRHPTDVDDVVQETFLIVLEKLWQLADCGLLRRWICRIALHRAHRRYRERWLREHEDAFVLEQRASDDPSPQLRAELAMFVRAVDLPRELRAPWMLKHVIGAKLEDVARACAISLATTKRRLAKAESIISRFVGANEVS
jgi:RNA polymerase sigma-70 factor (ECF subfamily)